jgi:hypothetical protein
LPGGRPWGYYEIAATPFFSPFLARTDDEATDDTAARDGRVDHRDNVGELALEDAARRGRALIFGIGHVRRGDSTRNSRASTAPVKVLSAADGDEAVGVGQLDEDANLVAILILGADSHSSSDEARTVGAFCVFLI